MLIKAEISLKFTAEVTVKVNGMLEFRESKRSVAENYGVLESPSERVKGARPMPTGLCRFKDMIVDPEEKESAECCSDFDIAPSGQLSECLTITCRTTYKDVAQ
jgi:hypothetical protein